MSGFHGPKGKIARSLHLAVSPKTAKILERRSYGPGDHGMLRKRSASVYRIQLQEKQRLRFLYNISESQMRLTWERACRRGGSKGENLLCFLETRLDATIFRLGFARSMFAARQYVDHGHFEVNGRRTFVPSFRLRPGDIVSLRASSLEHPQIAQALAAETTVPEYLLLDKVARQGRLLAFPKAAQIPVPVDMQLIVEHYSR